MLTVLFATRNRAGTLGQALSAFSLLQSPLGGWKLVVIDNGSTDRTGELLSSFAGRLPIHTVSEPRAGKNNALNASLHLLEGDLAVFTDDDAFPRPGWLVEMRRAADKHTDFTMFGGAILPRWEVPPPDWIRWVTDSRRAERQIADVRASVAFSITDPLQLEGQISPAAIFGPNMAIRTSVFQSGLRFDPSIGPRDGSYPMGSETQILVQLGKLGHKAWHVPSAVVEHFIRKEQFDKSWIFERAARFGRGQYLLSGQCKVSNTSLVLRAPLHLAWRLSQEGARMALAWVTLQDEAHFRARWRFNFFLGEGIEMAAQVRERFGRTDAAVPSSA